MNLVAIAVLSPVPYALWHAVDNAEIAPFVGAFRLWNGDNFDWRIAVAIAAPTPSNQGNSTDRDDEWAERSVRNVRASTNANRFAKNGLEKDRIRKQALVGPMRAARSPRSSLIAELITLQ